MRKLKNVELVGETRYAPGLGLVKFEAEMPDHIAAAFDAVGVAYFEPAAAENADAQITAGENASANADEGTGEVPMTESVGKKGKK
jgi:hypothetical protein